LQKNSKDTAMKPQTQSLVRQGRIIVCCSA